MSQTINPLATPDVATLIEAIDFAISQVAIGRFYVLNKDTLEAIRERLYDSITSGPD